ncbi:MAG: class Ib ribonucleoside-diphosphate reductase assembly flavoprotein NrdI [Culicoidibacterales bacterium]
MKIAYISQTGNVASFVEKLGLDAMEVYTGTETMDEPFVLITYTDGLGDIPDIGIDFLEENHALLRGVVASGNMGWSDTYCLAADAVHEQYGVPILGKIEDDGTDEDVAAIRATIVSLNK